MFSCNSAPKTDCQIVKVLSSFFKSLIKQVRCVSRQGLKLMAAVAAEIIPAIERGAASGAARAAVIVQKMQLVWVRIGNSV